MACDIRVITDKAELDGTAYIELLAGKYNGKCWNEGSLFFEEEVFGYLEPTVKKCSTDFDHYAFTELTQDQCIELGDALKSLSAKIRRASKVSELSHEVGFIFESSRQSFSDGFLKNAEALALVCLEVAHWLTEQSKRHGTVTILGM